MISIHALLAESDSKRYPVIPGNEISIHALLAESDMSKRLIELWKLRFLSTLSLRRATDSAASQPSNNQISIHALLAESDGCVRYCIHAQGISIHALLAESDVWPGRLARPFFIISIHALLAESDAVVYDIVFMPREFLSTLSLRRATMVTH